MLKEIIIHVGHGKTASSYLQTALALSADKLLEVGIDYPVNAADIKKAKSGRLTKGNFTRHDNFSDLKPQRERLLLSSESFFQSLWSGNLAKNLRKFFPNVKVTILLFVRNPVSNAASSYMQALQKGVEKRTFSDYLEYFNRPSEVAAAIAECKTAGFEIKIANFSMCKDRILETFSAWLDIPEIQAPEHRRSNRTLTRSEAALLLPLNQRLPRGATNRLGSLLCAEITDIDSSPPLANSEKMSAFLVKMEKQITATNRIVGHDIYTIDLSVAKKITSDEIDDNYQFTSAQLKLISKVLAEVWNNQNDLVN